MNLMRDGLACVALVLFSLVAFAEETAHCPSRKPGQPQLLWGDLHVHTAWSMDAYAFGTRHTPRDAYAFARGQELLVASTGKAYRIDRPLDFVAITDHAETFDVMYLCTDPQYADTAYCAAFRQGSKPATARETFRDFLLPLITVDKPSRAPLCSAEGVDCDAASRAQWRRVRQYANEANTPCAFTAFVASEWSGTPGGSHWHRNLIFASDAVTPDVVDYVRNPSPMAMWQALEKGCRNEQGCDVLAIPHNSNMSDGGSFDVESESSEALRLRARYERLLEVHQSKGNSECLPENPGATDEDCGFEIMLYSHGSMLAAGGKTPDAATWASIRRGYARSLLQRGLLAWRDSGEAQRNPLQLGLIGSTDTHAAMPGAVAEDAWPGDVWGLASPQGARARPEYNPGGIVGVWAEENTREAIFAALKRREAYASSGPRIALRLQADVAQDKDPCALDNHDAPAAVMGGTLSGVTRGRKPRFTVRALRDTLPLVAVDIVKSELAGDRIVEKVERILDEPSGRADICLSWIDKSFHSDSPAFWYVRVLEQPRGRWSKLDCEARGDCATNPQLDVHVQDRAWSSPIWYLR